MNPPLLNKLPRHKLKNLHERCAFKSGSQLATILVGTISDIIFFFPCFFPCSDQKTYFANVDRSTQKSNRRHLSRPCQTFLGPQAALLDFEGIAGGERVPWVPLGRNFLIGMSNRHSSQSAFGWLTRNDVSGHYKQHYFFSLFFPPLSSTFLIEGVL